MKKIVGIALSMILIVSMSLVLTGCGTKDNNSASEVLSSNIDVNNENQNSDIQYEKVIKVELVKSDNQIYEQYDYYIYYYFKNDVLVLQDNVYIFDTVQQAQQWYDSHIEALQDKTISKLEDNKVVDKDNNSQYINWKYDDVLKTVKNSLTTISYTEE